MSRPRERRYRVSRHFEAGRIVTLRELRESEEFVTIITRKSGVVLERRHDAILVGLEDVERRIHPQVRVEVA